jgi:hypothetical protein
VTGKVEPRDAPASSANDCAKDFRNDSPAGTSALEPAIRPAERVAALARGCNSSASADASPCLWATVQEQPKAVERCWRASPLAWGLSPFDLVMAPIDGGLVVRGSCRTQRVRSDRGANTVATRSPLQNRRSALRAYVFPAKAVPSRGRQVAAERDTATCPRSDQRVGSVEQPRGCSRRALRVDAPQGSEDFGERSDAEVYGATPSSAAKETATLLKVPWGGGRSRGRRSPSGESPKASRGATTKSVHPSISVEGCEA